MTKTVLMLAIAGAMMAGCATTPTAPNAGSNVAPQNTYRVQGGMQQAQQVPTTPVVAPAAPCVGCGDPTYFDRVMADYDFRRPILGGCGDCGGDVWRFGIPGPVSWMPICRDCAPPVAPPMQPPAQPEPQPTPEPTPEHTKGDTPTTAPTTAPEGTTTVNY